VLVEAVVAEQETFEACYRRLWPSMVRLAHLISGSEGVAEEVVQDVFLGLQPRWMMIDNPDAYVRSAVVNRARTARRRAGRETPAEVADTAAVTGNPEVDEVWAALVKLPARQRAALVLRFYEDLSEADIADALGCRPGTVKSLIHRGLQRLERFLR
jgi:RNA polymerase sigma-70 factor (sigma-E family)